MEKKERKYHNANKLIKLAQDFEEINWYSISANKNIRSGNYVSD